MAYSLAKEVLGRNLSRIKESGLYKYERIITSPQSSKIKVEFPTDTPEKEVLNFCSNNYLGLSSHPDVIRAAYEGLEKRGYGMSSVRFICGTQDIHRELEKKLSEFLGMEDSCLFSSCFDANSALFEAVLDKEDAVISDRLVHASIIDGIRLCKAQKFIFEHSDMVDLENKLKEASKCRMRMIITDGVFSMDGDMAKLDEICALAERYDAMVAVDDSHATGFIGKTGRGTHEHFNVMDKVDVITTTFGKALGGAIGGSICGRKEIIETMKQKGRPYLFSNAIPPAIVYASIKVIELLSKTTERRDKLESLSSYWRSSIKELGFDIKEGNTPIVPIMLYDAKLAQDFSKDLYDNGVYVIGFSYPVVPKGEARIRTQISASHEKEQLDFAISSFKKVGEKYGILGLKKEEIIKKCCV